MVFHIELEPSLCKNENIVILVFVGSCCEISTIDFRTIEYDRHEINWFAFSHLIPAEERLIFHELKILFASKNTGASIYEQLNGISKVSDLLICFSLLSIYLNAVKLHYAGKDKFKMVEFLFSLLVSLRK